MNSTIIKFGFPQSLIAEFEHWIVLLRPAQPTLGSLILASKSDETAFARLDAAAFVELGTVVAAIEDLLRRSVYYSKLNYLMLMMVDPHVHFHVIPRYEGTRSACGLTIADAGWAGPPALAEAVKLSDWEQQKLVAWLRSEMPGGSSGR